MGFLSKLLNVGDAVGQGAMAYQQTKVQNDDREAEQRRRVLEEAILQLDYDKASAPEVTRYDIRDGQVVPQGGFTDRAEAERTAGAQRAAARRQRMVDNNREVLQAERVAEATARGRAAGAPQEAPGASSDVLDLPVTTQTAITQIGPALASLDRYEELAKNYLDRGFVSETMGALGVPAVIDSDRDIAIGQIESAKNAVLLNLKELGQLGVLNGPDMEIVENMIGDPVSLRAAMRNPQYVLSRIQEARQFIADRVRAYERTFDLDLSRATGGTPVPAMGGRGSGPGSGASGGNEQQRMWDAAAASLRSQGRRPEDVIGPRP